MSSVVSSPSCQFAGCRERSWKAGFCIEHMRQHKRNASRSMYLKKPIISKNKSTIDDLLTSIRGGRKFSRMVLYGIECFKRLAVDAPSAEEIVESGAIQEIVTTIQEHPVDEKLHAALMDAIAAFALTPSLAARIGQTLQHDFALFKHTLDTHRDSETHIATFNAIQALALNPSNMDAMASQGVLEAMTACAKRYPDNPDLLGCAASALSKFAVYKQEYADFIVHSGCLENIVAALKKFPAHSGLAQNLLQLLSNLSQTCSAEALDILKQIPGIVDSIVAALEAYPYDQKLVQWATQSLKALTGESDMRAALTVFMGDLQTDVELMQALQKVSSLLLVDTNVEEFFRHNGLEWLLATIFGAQEAGIQKITSSACRALQRCALDEHKIYQIFRHGGVKLLVSLLNNDPTANASVHVAALSALSSLIGSRAENANYIINCGGLASALALLAKVGDQEEFARQFADFIFNLAKFEESIDTLVKQGVIESICDLLKSYPHDPEVVLKGISALGRMAVSEENVKRMCASGLLPTLVNVLRDHLDDRDVTKAALLALETMALLPENVEELLKLGAIDVIKAAAARWAGDAEMEEMCSRALALLLKKKAAIDQAAAEKEERARQAVEAKRQLEELQRQREEEEERRRLDQEMADALARLKAQDEMEARRRDAEAKEREFELKKQREKEAEAAPKPFVPTPLRAVEERSGGRVWRSARDLFVEEDDDSELEREEYVIPPHIKQFLISGTMLIKHSKLSAPHARHFYVTHDLELLVWREPSAELTAKNTMHVTQIYGLAKGHSTPQLQRKQFGKPLAGDERCCFSVFGTDGNHNERSIDLEAKTETERERWINALGHLQRYVRSKKLFGKETLFMSSREKVVKQVKREIKKERAEFYGLNPLYGK